MSRADKKERINNGSDCNKTEAKIDMCDSSRNLSGVSAEKLQILYVKLYSADKTKENNSAFLGRKIRDERILNYATQTKAHEQSIIDLRIREITSLDADG